MLSAFLSSLILFAAAGGEAPWWNKPGLEVWKFVNLFIFLAVLIYILRRPLSEAFKARREGIRRELMRAQEERNAALAKLEEVEARLSRLDAEVTEIRTQSTKEAADERERLRLATEAEIEKLREQSRREIESAGKAARQELREFAAEQSVRLVEEMIRRDIKPEDDARLVSLRVEELGGVRH